MRKLLFPALITLVSAAAFAQDAEQCKVVIEGNDAMQFNIKTFTINKAACEEFTVELDHVGKLPKNAMGHNVVITAKADMDAVARDGIAAGIDNNYIKADDERILAATPLVGGGEQTEVTFSTEAFEVGGEYEFFCLFPGHYVLMKGAVVVE